jgi:predicted transcriptional regulator
MIPTPASLSRIRRKLDRQRIEAGKLHAQAQAVIARMYSEGQAPRLSFDRRLGPTWQLSPSGQRVDAEIAAVVIAVPDVVSAGDGLFADGPVQTWRLVGPA